MMGPALTGWFTIPSGRKFLPDFCAGLIEGLGDALSTAQVLTPTRRGARALARAFGDLSHDRPLLLPQIRAIGDLDEGEPPFDLEALSLDLLPPISRLKRRFELARLVIAHFSDGDMGLTQALSYADSLSDFFDSLALEEIDAGDRLLGLTQCEGENAHVVDNWALHWQVSVNFLNLVVKEWPKRLKELGFMDPSQRQVALIRRLVEQWQVKPPTQPTYLIGSTGSAPAMANLMGVVAALKSGAVVLPGLDLSLDDDAWAQIEESHPQFTMKSLLGRHHLGREAVKTWPKSLEGERQKSARRRLLNEALRPAEATKDWRKQIAQIQDQAGGDDPIEQGLKGLTRLKVADDEAAAHTIALLMLEGLQEPEKRVALITPDQTLTRRVSAHLSRYGLEADSSAGQALGLTSVGRYILEALKFWGQPEHAFAALSVLRHGLCRFSGLPASVRLENLAFRGAAPRATRDIENAIAKDEDAKALWDSLNPLPHHPQARLLGAHISAFLLWLESITEDGAEKLWAGADGAQSAALFSELLAEAGAFDVGGLEDFATLIEQSIAGQKVRTGGYTHPRLTILGAIEARLVDADRVILAGLEDGVWPQTPPLDPFLSRSMRKRLGLPSPERRVGLSAHDFVQAASNDEVFLIVRARSDGNPVTPSRWIWRLETLCASAINKTTNLKHQINGAHPVTEWIEVLGRGLANKPDNLMPAKPPEPKPPVADRPRKFSVTRVEALLRDPYGVYAEKILRLSPLDRPHEPLEARERGTLIHKAIEIYTRLAPVPLGMAGEQALLDALYTAFEQTKLSEAELALKKPLFNTMAKEFVKWETNRTQTLKNRHIEQKGEIRFDTENGAVVLTAKADRIDVCDDGIDIIDYKTGQPPSAKQVVAGFSPQLTLTASIVKGGGFSDVKDAPLNGLYYVQVKSDAIKETRLKDNRAALDVDAAADQALGRFKTLVAQFDKPETAYESQVRPFKSDSVGDYDHLARRFEWAVLGDDEGADTVDSTEAEE